MTGSFIEELDNTTGKENTMMEFLVSEVNGG